MICRCLFVVFDPVPRCQLNRIYSFLGRGPYKASLSTLSETRIHDASCFMTLLVDKNAAPLQILNYTIRNMCHFEGGVARFYPPILVHQKIC